MNRNRSRTKVWKQALACLAVAVLGWPEAAPEPHAFAAEAPAFMTASQGAGPGSAWLSTSKCARNFGNRTRRHPGGVT